MELREPKRKRRFHVTQESPFPVPIESVTGIPASDAVWKVCTGKYNGDCVVVHNSSEIFKLYYQGFFGKGSLSRSFPDFGKIIRGIPPLIRQRQWELRCSWAEHKNDSHFTSNQGNEIIETAGDGHGGKSVSVKRLSDNGDNPSNEENMNCSAGEFKKNGAYCPSGEEGNMHIIQQVSCENRKTEIEEHTDLEFPPADSGVQQVSNKNRKTEIEENTELEFPPADSGVQKVSCRPKKRKAEIEEHTDLEFPLAVSGVQQVSCKKHKTEIEEHAGLENPPIDSGESFEKCNKNTIENQGASSSFTLSSTQQEEKVVIVLPDSDDELENYMASMKPKLQTEPFPLSESLHLTLEEAFFLSYALGCLKVLDLFGENLSLTNMWQLFCDSQKDFIQSYVAYHYFRAKNWVVKPGVKFGGDFVLYKQGPPFYHASYIVKIEVIDEKTKAKIVEPGNQALSWTRLMGLHRLAETAAKEILLCQVVWPTDLPESAVRSPKVLSRFTVQELLIRRWVTSKEREKDFEDL